jgi:hypothetical protein
MKVTIFGQSAGATAVFELALSSHIRGLARAAVRTNLQSIPWKLYKTDPYYRRLGSRLDFCPPSVQSVEKEYIWQTFVGAVPGCTSFAKSSDSLTCLRTVNTSSIFQGAQVAIPPVSDIPETALFPNIDGPGGLVPDVLSKIVSAERLSTHDHGK